eukprot:gene2534-biopygen2502
MLEKQARACGTAAASSLPKVWCGVLGTLAGDLKWCAISRGLGAANVWHGELGTLHDTPSQDGTPRQNACAGASDACALPCNREPAGPWNGELGTLCGMMEQRHSGGSCRPAGPCLGEDAFIRQVWPLAAFRARGANGACNGEPGTLDGRFEQSLHNGSR